jgi:hypothetical protein
MTPRKAKRNYNTAGCKDVKMSIAARRFYFRL